jgi:hypothetical protein
MTIEVKATRTKVKKGRTHVSPLAHLRSDAVSIQVLDIDRSGTPISNPQSLIVSQHGRDRFIALKNCLPSSIEEYYGTGDSFTVNHSLLPPGCNVSIRFREK